MSEKTSSLKDLIQSSEFKRLSKINSWFPLILCMMYESQKENSLWKPYFDILPRNFDTPMFWNEEELAELEGTGVIGMENCNSLNCF
jgi:SET domain-containing protein 6